MTASSNISITGGRFTSNSASANGGHLLASGTDTNVHLQGPLVFSDGRAELHGGALHAAGGAAITAIYVELSKNRAEGDGGAVSAIGAGLMTLDSCNVTGNSCGGSGGGVSVTRTEFEAKGSNFSDNLADSHGGGLRGFTGSTVYVEACGFYGNEAQVKLKFS